MSQFLKAAQFAMKMSLDKTLTVGEREQWFETAKQLFGEARSEK